METLMVQANSGMYRVQDTYFEECKQKLQRQDSKVSSEWDSFDMALWQKMSQESGSGTPPGVDSIPEPLLGGAAAYPLVGQDVFVEETSIEMDEESEWSLDIPN